MKRSTERQLCIIDKNYCSNERLPGTTHGNLGADGLEDARATANGVGGKIANEHERRPTTDQSDH